MSITIQMAMGRTGTKLQPKLRGFNIHDQPPLFILKRYNHGFKNQYNQRIGFTLSSRFLSVLEVFIELDWCLVPN